MPSLFRYGGDGAPPLLRAQPLPPRSEVLGDTWGSAVWAVSWGHGGQRYPLHRCGWGTQRHTIIQNTSVFEFTLNCTTGLTLVYKYFILRKKNYLLFQQSSLLTTLLKQTMKQTKNSRSWPNMTPSFLCNHPSTRLSVNPQNFTIFHGFFSHIHLVKGQLNTLEKKAHPKKTNLNREQLEAQCTAVFTKALGEYIKNILSTTKKPLLFFFWCENALRFWWNIHAVASCLCHN